MLEYLRTFTNFGLTISILNLFELSQRQTERNDVLPHNYIKTDSSNVNIDIGLTSSPFYNIIFHIRT